MPAYELREHLPTHGYAVLGKFPSPDAAKEKRDALVREDPRRMGHYTIDYVQQAEPDQAPPEAKEVRMSGYPTPDGRGHTWQTEGFPSTPNQEETDDMGLMRTSGHRPQGLPKNSAADMVEGGEGDKPVRGSSTAAEAVESLGGKEPKVSAAAKAAGAKKP